MSVDNSELQKALSILDMPTQALPQSKSTDDELKRALAILDSPQQPKSELSFMDKAAQLGRGIASGMGVMYDLAASGSVPFSGRAPGESMGLMLAGKAPEEIQSEKAVRDPNLSFEKELTELYDKLYGKKLEPTDTAGKFRQGVGQLLTPVPGSRYVKEGKLLLDEGIKAVPKFLKFLGKQFGQATGGSAAIHATPNITEEGSAGRLAEDIAKGVIGGVIGGAPLKTAKGIGDLSEGIVNTIAHPIKSTQKGIAKLMSMGANPDATALDIAKAHEIELPHHIGMNNKILSGIENNYLNKSMFTSQQHKDVYKKAATKMLDEVNKTLESVSKNSFKPSEASNRYRDVLSKERSLAKKQASELYNKANSYIKEGDNITPKNSSKAISDLSKKMDRDLQSPETEYVAKLLAKLGKNWGIVPNKLASKFESQKFDNKNLKDLISNFSGNTKEIPLERLVGVDQELEKILRRTEDVPGVKKLLYGLKDAVYKDIESSSNNQFLEAYKEAKGNYAENVGKRFHTKTPISVLKKDMPTEAFSKMNSVQGINALEKSIGSSKKGQKVFGELKRAKLEEMLDQALVGGIDSKSISNANFTKLFAKNKKRQEVLERLMGPKEYKKLEEISKITNAFSEAGKDIINTSGTAPIAAEWSKLDRAAQAALLVLLGTEPISALVVAGGAVAAPNVLSRLVSNPAIVNQARTYARAKQLGNNKYADTLMKKLITMVQDSSKLALIEANNQKTKTKEGEKK